MSKPSTAFVQDDYQIPDHPLHETVKGLLAQRYGAARIPGISGLNDTLEHLLAHRSVRRYLPRPVSDQTLEFLVAAAQSAATSSNLQLWSVVTVADPERRRELAKVAGGQAHVAQSPLFLVWLADLHRVSEIADRRGTSKGGIPYLETFLSAVVDTALAAQNAVVAAESLGLGTVYIGAVRNQPNRVAEILSLPPNVFAVFGMCIGWPDRHQAATATGSRAPSGCVPLGGKPSQKFGSLRPGSHRVSAPDQELEPEVVDREGRRKYCDRAGLGWPARSSRRASRSRRWTRVMSPATRT